MIAGKVVMTVLIPGSTEVSLCPCNHLDINCTSQNNISGVVLRLHKCKQLFCIDNEYYKGLLSNLVVNIKAGSPLGRDWEERNVEPLDHSPLIVNQKPMKASKFSSIFNSKGSHQFPGK